MKAVSWNDGWTVKHLDETGEGTPVRIPHDAMLAEKKARMHPVVRIQGGMRVMITYMKKISYRVMNIKIKKNDIGI